MHANLTECHDSGRGNSKKGIVSKDVFIISSKKNIMEEITIDSGYLSQYII